MPSLILGTLIAISSSSWFSAWIGLEINLISIAPLLINKIKFPSVEATIKYFITQAIASSLLIFMVFISTHHNFFRINSLTFKALILCSLLTKAGVAPLHFWFPQVILCSDWLQSFILLTWQKIAPFILISFISINILFFFIISSAIFGVLGGINQTSFILILTYSSILHSSWIISLVIINETQWWTYFLFYSLIVFSISYSLYFYNSKKISEINNLWIPQKIKMLFFINFLSIAGLPPFLGFMIKFLAIFSILRSPYFPLFIPIFLAGSSFLSFYFYLRITYSFLFTISSIKPIFSKTESTNTILDLSLASTILSTIGIVIAPLLFSFA